MSSRSIVISVFIICCSFGIIWMNTINDCWDTGCYGEAGYSKPLIEYSITPPVNYSDVGDISEGGYNLTYTELLTYDKPADATQDFGFFQNLAHAKKIVDVILIVVWGIPIFLENLGMPAFMSASLGVLILINHMFTIIYLVTGKSIY